jgi:hypothetical protein
MLTHVQTLDSVLTPCVSKSPFYMRDVSTGTAFAEDIEFTGGVFTLK